MTNRREHQREITQIRHERRSEEAAREAERRAKEAAETAEIERTLREAQDG